LILRIKICRKEAKECGYWLKLLEIDQNKGQDKIVAALFQETTELTNIFGAILKTLK